ncbi:DUF2806 domain-containing protein [Brucella pseudogrignonensis]|uniref:DUF2806 domain-containing protein n=1 Tax=Brucella pseudogrignonensis TaxID=419475 RepID=UPI0038D0E58A
MTDQQKNSGWLETLMDGGLPQVLAGPAGKAISRLIGAAAEIPAAKLEQIAQGIRDETKAKSQIMETLAEKSAELGLADQKLLERGLNSMLGKAYREQLNREEVARKTIEYLTDDPAPETSPGPSDDWMDVFEDYASKASSDSVRDMFSRILAGEIRKPGDFSRATLHFVSILDTEVAKIIEKLSPYSIDNNFFPKDLCSKEVGYGEWLVLEEAGFLSFAGGNLSITQNPDAQGIIVFRMGVNLILYKPKNNNSINLPAVKLTLPGGQLLKTIEPKYKVEEFASWLWALNPDDVLIAEIGIGWDGKEFAKDPISFPKPIK